MSAFTTQKVRGTVGQQSGQSANQAVSTKTWSKVFPTKLTTEQGSCVFVKKLVTVAISSITYLRSMFPEDAYASKSLDKLSLKILKEKTDCENAATLAGWLLGAFEAIEKKYLKSLMLVVYMDPATRGVSPPARCRERTKKQPRWRRMTSTSPHRTSCAQW